MPNGIVKFFNAAKGFGFITPDDSAKDIFVPATSITAAGVGNLKAGQRVSFNALPDTKGPKAVDLKLIGPAPAPIQAPTYAPRPEGPAPVQNRPHRLTLYIDPEDADAGDVLEELRQSGHDPLVVDYIASPPSKEELKRLSLLLRASDQSVVRKYEPLFRELRLDDRFISDSEYWEAVFEHPSLINGPIVTTALKAGLCHSTADVKAFLAVPDSDNGQPAVRRKELSPGLLHLISGGTAPPPAAPPVAIEPALPIEDAPEKKPQLVAKPKPAEPLKAKSKTPVKAKPKAATSKPEKKPAAKVKKR